MAVVESGETISRGFSNLTVIRQIGLLLGLAASIAIGVGVANWSRSPDYRVLYSSLALEDVSEVVAVLERMNIKYQVSESSGTIMVPSDEVQEARISLASEGLPKGTGSGYEILEKEKGFGISHFMENIRYQRALEGELARTINSIKSVRNARVHLALPKNTAFLREKRKATASVAIDLFPGRNLDNSQVGAIAHLVAASIPDLEAHDVTVIDQTGRLLSQSGDSSDIAMTESQLEYRKSLEGYYISRIENILVPILGEGAVRAQVSADIDFTVTEQTQESFNPDLPAIRNEQLISEESHGDAKGGIPGSLSNQPPEVTDNVNNSDMTQTSGQTSSRTVRNYELDKTISHTRYGGNALKRLSVAVVVDNERVVNDNGEVEYKSLDDEKLAKITDLVKKTVGFDVGRGDTINVINSRFFEEPIEDVVEEKSLLDNPNLIVLAKYIGAGMIIMFLVFGVLKPILKELAKVPAKPLTRIVSTAGAHDEETGTQNTMIAETNYEDNLKTARKMASEDPKRVAQVINNWVTSDG